MTKEYSPEEKVKIRRSFVGIFVGPLLMVGGQSIVLGLDPKTVVGWVLTAIGFALLLISAGIAVDIALD